MRYVHYYFVACWISGAFAFVAGALVYWRVTRPSDLPRARVVRR